MAATRLLATAILFFFTPTLFGNAIYKESYSTFGLNFKKGVNKSCSDVFFKSPIENYCEIRSVGQCDEIDEIKNYVETEDLNVIPEIFKRKFRDYPGSHRVGINISFPLLNNHTEYYAIKFKIPAREPPLSVCQVIDIRNLPKPRRKTTLWNNQYFFDDGDQGRNFTIEVVEFPSGKMQKFSGQAPGYTELDSGVWKPVIFAQLFSCGKIVVHFSSAPVEYKVKKYVVKLMSDNRKVVQEKILRNDSPFQKVYLRNPYDDGIYFITAEGICEKCSSGEFQVYFTTKKNYSAIWWCISILIISLVAVIVFLIFYFKRQFLYLEIYPKVLIVNSYDCEVHQTYINALQRALEDCNFEVTYDRIRRIEQIEEWYPYAIQNSDILLIVWSQGAVIKGYTEQQRQQNLPIPILREPGNSASRFFYQIVHHALQQRDYQIVNVLWDQKIQTQINPAFGDRFPHIVLPKQWKSLLRLVYKKNAPIKRWFYRMVGEDLSDGDFPLGQAFLQAQRNLERRYVLETEPEPGNINEINIEMNEPDEENANQNQQNHDSGFGEESQPNTIDGSSSYVNQSPTLRQKIAEFSRSAAGDGYSLLPSCRADDGASSLQSTSDSQTPFESMSTEMSTVSLDDALSARFGVDSVPRSRETPSLNQSLNLTSCNAQLNGEMYIPAIPVAVPYTPESNNQNNSDASHC